MLAEVETARTVELSPFQERLQIAPENVSIANLGGRGSGKTIGMLMLVVKHVRLYGPDVRVWLIRRSFPGLSDLERDCRRLFGQFFPDARYNGSTHTWSFGNGAIVELGILDSEASFSRWQGRSATLICIDELGQYESPYLVDMLRSCLRGPAQVPSRMIATANPGNVGTAWIYSRFYGAGVEDWTVFDDETGRRWLRATSIYSDNPFINQGAYRSELEAATRTDLELRKAWISGSFEIMRGQFFANVLDESNRVQSWPTNWRDPTEKTDVDPLSVSDEWELFWTFDHGVAVPSVALLVAWSPGGVGGDGVWYDRGSLCIVDEVTSWDGSNDCNTGLGWTVSRLAAEIVLGSKRWRCEPAGIADPSIFARSGLDEGSVGQQLQDFGVHFSPAPRVDRISGWEKLRELMLGSDQMGKPGLYVARDCIYTWRTVPHLARDTRKPQDVDASGPAHSADCLRYASLHEPGPAHTSHEFRR